MFNYPNYRPGDIVARTDFFAPLGRVMTASEPYTVAFIQSTIQLQSHQLTLISIRNNPNLRLVSSKIDIAIQSLAGVNASNHHAFRHEVIQFAGLGDIAARAFADYVLKIPSPILTIALEHLLAAKQPITEAIDQKMNIHFRFLSQ